MKMSVAVTLYIILVSFGLVMYLWTGDPSWIVLLLVIIAICVVRGIRQSENALQWTKKKR